MLVLRVLMPFSSLESWTVFDDGGPVAPIKRYLAYLTDIERSPNTVKAYAHDLKDWLEFLDLRGLDWREVRLEDLGEFVGWLRLPPAGRDGGVAMLPSADHHCSAATVNRKLSAVSGLYTFHARHGVDLGDLVTELQVDRQSVWRGSVNGRNLEVQIAGKTMRVVDEVCGGTAASWVLNVLGGGRESSVSSRHRSPAHGPVTRRRYLADSGSDCCWDRV